MTTGTGKVLCATVLAAGLGAQATASATTVFDSLSGATSEDYQIVEPGVWAATSFSIDSLCSPSCDLESLTLSLWPEGYRNEGSANPSLGNLSLSITETLRGTPISTLSAQLFDNSFVNTWNDVVFTPDSSQSLQSGVEYWAELTNDVSDGWGWRIGEDVAGAEGAYNIPGFGTFRGSPYALKVEGEPEASPIPIPGAFWLLGSALVGLPLVARKRPVKAM